MSLKEWRDGFRTFYIFMVLRSKSSYTSFSFSGLFNPRIAESSPFVDTNPRHEAQVASPAFG